MPPSEVGAWQRTFASLQHAAFRRFFAGLLCNMVGFWLRIAATGLFVFELTGSRERLGVITAAALLPWIPIAPMAGVVADRINPRTQLICVYVLLSVVNVALGVGILQEAVGWDVLLWATIGTGCLRGMEMPARHAIVRRLVDRSALSSAIGLNAAGFHLMNAIGFSLAGVLYEAYGAGACFVAVGGTSLLMAVQMLRVQIGPGHAVEAGRHPLRDLREGFGYVWDHGITRTLVFGAAAVVALLLSFRVLMPAIADDVLGLTPRGYGALMAVSGAGSFLAALWIAAGAGGHGRRIRHLFTMVWLACAAVLAVAWTDRIAVAACAVFVAGFCQVGFMAGANTTVQETVPDSLRARVMGIWALLFGLAYPVGGWLQGYAAERWEETTTLTVGVAAAFVLSLLVYKTSARRLSIALRDEMRKADEQLW